MPIEESVDINPFVFHFSPRATSLSIRRTMPSKTSIPPPLPACLLFFSTYILHLFVRHIMTGYFFSKLSTVFQIERE